MVAVFSQDRDIIFKAVQDMYTEVASLPEKEFHFPTGRSACEFVGYPADLLDSIPATATESFAGVGFPFKSEIIKESDHVLDIGSGSGTDVLIASQITGNNGKVYGLDMTRAMLDKVENNIRVMGATNVVLLEGNAEEIPLPDSSIDVITSNGVLNLVPNKPKAFAEIFRILKPGGHVQIADIVVGLPINEASRNNPKLWAECIVGASLKEQYIDMFKAAGFEDITTLSEFDYFAGSSSQSTREVAASFGAGTVEIVMRKP